MNDQPSATTPGEARWKEMVAHLAADARILSRWLASGTCRRLAVGPHGAHSSRPG
jgi:hypothetical protein